jgi:Zn-dependent protease
MKRHQTKERRWLHTLVKDGLMGVVAFLLGAIVGQPLLALIWNPQNAVEFDRHMIESGIESTSRVSGPDRTALQITYALAGRVTANEFGKKIAFGQLKALRFKKVILTNGFGGDLGQAYEWPVL